MLHHPHTTAGDCDTERQNKSVKCVADGQRSLRQIFFFHTINETAEWTEKCGICFGIESGVCGHEAQRKRGIALAIGRLKIGNGKEVETVAAIELHAPTLPFSIRRVFYLQQNRERCYLTAQHLQDVGTGRTTTQGGKNGEMLHISVTLKKPDGDETGKSARLVENGKRRKTVTRLFTESHPGFGVTTLGRGKGGLQQRHCLWQPSSSQRRKMKGGHEKISNQGCSTRDEGDGIG